MRALRTVLLFALVFLLCFSFAGAEEKKGESGYEAYSLGEIYVTGEKTPVTQQTTISNTITAEDIKATNSRTVSEALSFAPGISVTTGTKNEPNISIHGFFDQSRILVLIDGVPYYETKYGKLDLSQFTTDNVAKI
ncbi:MAG: Plug domain-containing protein, partial [Deltaproteobacteria bacterium]